MLSKLVASPLVVLVSFFRCGCVICVRNAARRIPQIDDDPVIHTFPYWLVAYLPEQRGRFLHTVAIARVIGWAGRAKGSIPYLCYQPYADAPFHRLGVGRATYTTKN